MNGYKPIPVDQPTPAPTAKVTAATLAAALALIFLTVLDQVFGIDFLDLVDSLAIVISAFLGGYFRRERA